MTAQTTDPLINDFRWGAYRGSIVAIVGPIGSGKTTTANALNSYKRISFADALREEVAGVLSTTPEQKAAILAEMRDPKVKAKWRHILQAWGTIRRNMDEDYWVHCLADTMFEAVNDRKHVVIDDCRYNNEHTFLRQHGAKFFSLAPNPEYSTDPEFDKHASEQDWKLFPVDMHLPWGPVEERTGAILQYMQQLGLY